MTNWEYMTFTADRDPDEYDKGFWSNFITQDDLDEQGEIGWELVAYKIDEDGNIIHATFKRELK
jgi:hypothetical protein